jgi:hypothetical protein
MQQPEEVGGRIQDGELTNSVPTSEQSDLLGADLIISAFATALGHYRRANGEGQ